MSDTKLITLPRRALLFAAPALVAAASLMKVRSIDRLFFKEYDEIVDVTWGGEERYLGRSRNDVPQLDLIHPAFYSFEISKGEFEWNKKRLLKGPHVNVGDLSNRGTHIVGGKFITIV